MLTFEGSPVDPRTVLYFPGMSKEHWVHVQCPPHTISPYICLNIRVHPKLSADVSPWPTPVSEYTCTLEIPRLFRTIRGCQSMANPCV